MKVTTNNAARPVLDASELTSEESREFDYLDWDALKAGNDSASFFRYKGQVYDIGSFMRTTAIPGWDGYMSDSFFSGLLVKFTPDGESVIAGRYVT